MQLSRTSYLKETSIQQSKRVVNKKNGKTEIFFIKYFYKKKSLKKSVPNFLLFVSIILFVNFPIFTIKT